jgi:hypothetical protein
VLAQRRNSPESRLLSRSYREELLSKGMKRKVADAAHLDSTVRTLVQIKPRRNARRNSSVVSGEGYSLVDNTLNVIESTLTPVKNPENQIGSEPSKSNRIELKQLSFNQINASFFTNLTSSPTHRHPQCPSQSPASAVPSDALRSFPYI